MALVEHTSVEVYDAFQERQARCLWVGDADVLPYPTVRAAKLERRRREAEKARLEEARFAIASPRLASPSLASPRLA